MVGRFDEEFLAVPHEIICESMLKNQRYFPVYDASHNLTCNFVVVSNGDPACEATIIDGNERVVRARLDDAKFFYEEDLKTPLDELGTRLESVVFQEQLGTMAQKVERMEAVAPAVAAAAGVSEEEVAATQRAAALAKADLVSQAVVEFTSQQGTMGGYYARQGGEGEAVATAIAQQYRPRFAGDVLPETTVAKALSIADKIDTICGMFAIGEPPTGSSDPFAQRRGAIGIINMLLALPAVSLDRLIQASLESYQAQGLEFDLAATKAKVHDFFLGRLETIAKDDGSAPDSIEAVASVGVIHPRDFMARVAALDEARRTQPELFEDLATAYARAAHLSDPSLGTSVDLALLSAPEKALYEACSSAQSEVSVALEAHDYAAALAALASLREPIDAFFDDVMVMDEDAALRKNRLKLLNRFVEVFTGVANFSLLSRA
jgi:glycyl-tRNA synthetase beta chain